MTTPTEERELRLALVMTGGVSLAVWMGGVSAEVYRLVRREGVYGELLDLTGTRATVDVISGSSAGGLNGALLGTALAYDLPTSKFDELRNLWFDAGSFSRLLRNPKDKNPPSLLLGDDYFTTQIRGVLGRWVDAGTPRPADSNPLTVVLTAALLSPDLQRRADVFGVSIDEPVHSARFTFHAGDFAESATLPGRLALAARTSASFPGAFEPSFIPIGAADATSDRPDMSGIASFSSSRWAVDGGVLMNKPVAPALELIESRPAVGEVRRVLAYVNPDPGAPTAHVDLATDMPSLATVVMSSLLTLPRAQSIASDLNDIADYNRRFSGRQQARDRLVWGRWTSPVTDDGPAATPEPADPGTVRDDLARTAEAVYPLWVRKRTVQAVRTRIESHLSRARLEMTSRRGDDQHGFTYDDLRAAMEEARLATSWLPQAMPSVDELAGGEWHYGFTPLEYLTSLLIDLVQRGFALLPAPVDDTDEHDALRLDLGAVRLAAYAEQAWLRALRAADDDYYAYWLDHLEALGVPMCAADLARAIYGQWPEPPLDLQPSGEPSGEPSGHQPRRRRLGRVAAAKALPDEGERARRLRVWRLVQQLLRGDDEREGAAESKDVQSVQTRMMAGSARSATADDLTPLEPHLGLEHGELQHRMRQAELRIARRLAEVALRLGSVLEEVVEAHIAIYNQPTRTMTVSDCAPVPQPWEPIVLRQTARVLALSDGQQGAPADIEADVLLNVSRLYFVHATVEDDAGAQSARINFVQVAATAPNELDPERRVAADKVAGLQLGHFGGFVKESWRANDWMWGALDGASRLVPLLLDPVRFRQRFPSSERAVDAVRALATAERLPSVTSEERVWLQEEWRVKHAAAVEEELAFLDPELSLSPPSELRATAAAIIRLAQLLIAARELPEVKKAIEHSTSGGADENSAASSFTEQMSKEKLEDERLLLPRVPALLKACRVGSERVADELGSDAGAAIATKAAAVAATAASGSRSGLGPLRHVAKAARLALLATYYTALAAARRSKIGFALVTLLLAVGAGAVAARLVGGDVPDSVLVVAISALAFWVLLTGVTAGAWGFALGGVALLGVIALSYVPAEKVCITFAATCDPAVDRPGWKGTIHYLVPGVLVLLAVLFAVVAFRTNGRRADDAQRTGVALTIPRRVWTWTPSILFAGLAALYWWVLDDALFTGDATRGRRKWVVHQLEGWSRANVLVVLIGLPLLFILLGYIRQAYRDDRIESARRRALRRATGS